MKCCAKENLCAHGLWKFKGNIAPVSLIYKSARVRVDLRFHEEGYKSLLLGGVDGGLVVMFTAARTPRSEVQTPARTETWIKISAPWAALLCLWGHNIRHQSLSQAWKLTWKVSKWRVDQMDADTSVVKKKHEWNSMAGEEEWMEKTPKYGRRQYGR